MSPSKLTATHFVSIPGATDPAKCCEQVRVLLRSTTSVSPLLKLQDQTRMIRQRVYYRCWSCRIKRGWFGNTMLQSLSGDIFQRSLATFGSRVHLYDLLMELRVDFISTMTLTARFLHDFTFDERSVVWWSTCLLYNRISKKKNSL